MKTGIKAAVISLSASLLTGCLGGDGGVVDTVAILDAAPQQNGLPYAVAGRSLAAAEGVVITAPVASFSDRDGARSDVVQITLGRDFFANPSDGGDMLGALFGETITITNGEGTLANGQTVRLFYDPAASGDYAGALQLASYAALTNPAPMTPVDVEAYFLFGFLADPEVMNARISGDVRYAGDVAATGLVTINGISAGDPTGTELDAAITLSVDFADDRLSGHLRGNYTAATQVTDVDLALPISGFEGNTFAGVLACDQNCTSDSTIDGGFFGPSGEEIGGILSLDITHDIDGDTYVFTGAGSFVATPE